MRLMWYFVGTGGAGQERACISAGAMQDERPPAWGDALYVGSDRQAESVLDAPFTDFVQPACVALYASIVIDAFDGILIARTGVTLRSKALIPEVVVGRNPCHTGCQAIAGVAQHDCHGSLYSC